MICHHLDRVGNHLQSSAMSAADVADFLGISDARISTRHQENPPSDMLMKSEPVKAVATTSRRVDRRVLSQ